MPGQWLDTYVPGITKAGGFTVTSSPSTSGAAPSGSGIPYLELAVQESPENPIARWLWQPKDQILGRTLQVRIGGSFVFPPLGNSRLQGVERVVFIAGGVGINPLMSMLSYIGERKDLASLEVMVLYGSKVLMDGSLESILFVRRIASLISERKINGRFELYLTRHSEDQSKHPLSLFEGEHRVCGTDIQGHTGRLSASSLAARFGGTRPDSTIFYVCGPPSMTDKFVASLTASRPGPAVAPSHVMTERWW